MKISLVFMVAGMSSRFGGKIKQFAKVGPSEETLIEYSINQALKSPFDEIIFIVGHKTEDSFKEMFGNSYKGIPVKYAKQYFDPELRDRPWGSTDAVVSAKDVIEDAFCVLNGDDIYGEDAFKQIYAALQTHACSIGYKLEKVIPDQGSVNRGIFQEINGNVTNIQEVFDITKNNLEAKGLTGESLCSMNIFGLHKKDLVMLEQILQSFKKEHEGDRKIECLLPTDLNTLIKNKELEMKLLSTTSTWYGVTNPEDEQVVKELLRLDS